MKPSHVKYLALFLVLQLFACGLVYSFYYEHRYRLLEFDQKRLENQLLVLHGIHEEITELLYYTLDTTAFSALLTTASRLREPERQVIRKQLYSLLKKRYRGLQQDHHVVQLNFYLPDGRLFLKMDDPQQFGTILPEPGKPTVEMSIGSGITTGYSDGVHNILPLLDTEGKQIGSMELVFGPQFLLNHFSMEAAHVEVVTLEPAKDSAATLDAIAASESLDAKDLNVMRDRYLVEMIRTVGNEGKDAKSVEIGGSFYSIVVLPLKQLNAGLPDTYFVAYIKNHMMGRIREMTYMLYGIVSLVNLLIALFMWRTSSARELEKVQQRLEYKKRVVMMAAEGVKSLEMAEDYREAVPVCLNSFLEVMGLCHSCIYVNTDDDSGAFLQYEAVSPERKSFRGEAAVERLAYDDAGIKQWRELFQRGEMVECDLSALSDTQHSAFAPYGIESLVSMPIHVNETLWGFVLFAECEHTGEDVWVDVEKNSLEMFALTLSAAIARQSQHEALIELTQTLESRVAKAIETNRKQERILFEQARSAQMGEMISMIAHQWRQPLNAISTAAIKLNFKRELKSLSDDDVADVSQFIQTQTQEMSQIINDFMYFFKPDSEKVRFSLASAVEEMQKMVGSQLKSRGIILADETELDIDIYGHKKEFVHILLNLVSNARDALDECSVEPKQVFLDAARCGERVLLRVSDNGCGIDPTIITRIFDPYFTTKEQGKGTGIGLYMVREMIVNDFGGDIEAENLESGGACFTLSLPLVPNTSEGDSYGA